MNHLGGRWSKPPPISTHRARALEQEAIAGGASFDEG